MNASAIKQTVALAERIPTPDLETHPCKINQEVARINHIEGLIKELLGVEDEARRTLVYRLNDVRSRLRVLEKEGERLQRLKEVGGRYQRLSLEPFTWRDAEGFPKLVIFTLDSPIFQLTVRPDIGHGIIEPKLPQKIEERYKDVLCLLEARRKKDKGLRLMCRFGGLIPREVREEIKKARETFGDQIFIIAEPKSFTLDAITLPESDPLIVGYDPGADEEGLWLVVDFDTTPIEEAMIFHPDNSRN